MVGDGLAAVAGVCARVVLGAFWASASSSCELTSKKWYSTINIMATEPRKMASLYRSSSEIIVFVLIGVLVFGVLLGEGRVGTRTGTVMRYARLRQIRLLTLAD